MEKGVWWVGSGVSPPFQPGEYEWNGLETLLRWNGLETLLRWNGLEMLLRWNGLETLLRVEPVWNRCGRILAETLVDFEQPPVVQ